MAVLTTVEVALMAFIGTTSLGSFGFNAFFGSCALPWFNGRFSGPLALAAAGAIFTEGAEIGEREIDGIVFERLIPTN